MKLLVSLFVLIVFLVSTGSAAAVDIIVTDADSVVGITPTPAPTDVFDSLEALPQAYSDIYIGFADSTVKISPQAPALDVYDSLEAPPQSYSQIYIGFADSVVNRELFPPEIPATVDIDPDTLNLKSKGRWITAYIELPEGYDVNDINVSTVRLNDTIAAEQHPAEVGDHDEDGIPDLMVKFDRRAVIDIVSGNATGEVELTVTGNLYSGISFWGSDTIRVIKKEEKLKDKNEKQECKYKSSDEEDSKDKKCKHGNEKHREGSDKEKEGQHEE